MNTPLSRDCTPKIEQDNRMPGCRRHSLAVELKLSSLILFCPFSVAASPTLSIKLDRKGYEVNRSKSCSLQYSCQHSLIPDPILSPTGAHNATTTVPFCSNSPQSDHL